MRKYIGAFKLMIIALALMLVSASQAWAWGEKVEKVLDSGPDGSKIVIVVVGEGYGANDQQTFANDVNALLVSGLFKHDFYSTNRKAFNVYRVDVVSADSGASTPQVKKRTAFDITYTGSWDDGWFKESANTSFYLDKVLRSVPKYDYVVILVNDSGWGGLSQGSRMIMTRGITWAVVGHELGHSIGLLKDEYGVRGTYSGPEVNYRNISTVLDRQRVVWAKYIDKSVPVPTPWSPLYDKVRTVGMFEGAWHNLNGIYRPVYECRMNKEDSLFCPVCSDYMLIAVKPYMPVQQSQPEKPGFRFLNFDFRIDSKGNWYLRKVSQVPGELVLKEVASSSYIYESFNSAKHRAVQFASAEPFGLRRFSAKGKKNEVEKQATQGNVIMNVPRMSIKQALDSKLGMRLYKLADDTHVDRIDVKTFDNLKEQKKLQLKVDIKPDKLASAMEQLLREMEQWPPKE